MCNPFKHGQWRYCTLELGQYEIIMKPLVFRFTMVLMYRTCHVWLRACCLLSKVAWRSVGTKCIWHRMGLLRTFLKVASVSSSLICITVGCSLYFSIFWQDWSLYHSFDLTMVCLEWYLFSVEFINVLLQKCI